MKNHWSTLTSWYLIIIIFLLISSKCASQTQVVRGIIQDVATREPLIGASIQLMDSTLVIGTITDFDGEFELNNVPIGRIRLRCDYLGYTPYITSPFILNSAKEPFLEIEMKESFVQLEEIVVKVERNDHRTQNELAKLSGRSFVAEETERYAGSIADPSRMAVSFAGVQASNDLDNDIVVRGNSSVGVLWRLEGIDIPNPNHFARRGSSGGGISIFSVNMLRNSDFIYGNPPAEYGNTLSSVFDMKFRKGSTEHPEYSFRAGLLGLDLVAEGPIKKRKSSYLLNYRYSTLGLLNDMGVHVVGENTDNNFTDLSYHLHFASDDNKNIFQLWGIGGLSSEIHQPISNVDEWEEYDDFTHTNFKTRMGVMGMNWTRLLNKDSYLKVKVAIMGDHITHDKDTVNQEFLSGFFLNENYNTSRLTGSVDYSRKINKKLQLKSGLTAVTEHYDLYYKAYERLEKKNVEYIDNTGNNNQFQFYLNGAWTANEKLSIVGGVHFLYTSLNESKSIEPRIALSYRINDNSDVALAYGISSQLIPLGTYFTQVDNLNLSLMKSQQWTAAFRQRIGSGYLFSIEGYYQKLFNIPVATDPSIHYWMLNDIVGYSKYSLTSDGKGKNYGLDMSIERFFDQGFFFMGSFSVYRALYSIDGSKSFNSRYDGKFNSSLAIGREITYNNGSVLQLGIRNLFYGGQWYSPPDDRATKAIGEYYDDLSVPLESQNKTYWRTDARISLRKNSPSLSWTLSLDVQNIINRKNTRGEIWNYSTQSYEDKLQAGIIPVISFQIDL